MFQSKILGTGMYHPEKSVTNFDLMQTLDTNNEWIVERTGISERRVSSLDIADEEFPSALAAHAAVTALKLAKLEPNDIDLILFSITYSEQSFPNTAAHLQKRLGITNGCPCLDINAACTGWTYGLQMADALIQSGFYKKIMLVGCEQPTSFLNWNDRNTAILFGDGGGVVILGASTDETSAILSSKLSCESEHAKALELNGGGILKPISPESFKNEYPLNIDMDGKVVFKNAVRAMAQLSKDVISDAGLSLNDVDWFIPHQANMRIIEAVARRLEFPMDKTITNIEFFGNTSSATIPTAMHAAIEDGRIKRGDIILVAAFGAGFTAGASILRY